MNNKFRAAHNLSALTPDGKVNKAMDLVAKIKASTFINVTKLPLNIADVETAIKNLDTAIASATSGGAGAVSHMHEMERVLVSVFNLLKAYIVLEANNMSDPKSAIESTGLSAVSGGGTTAVSELSLSALGNGIIGLSVPRGKGEAAFVYQYSVDAGTTWLMLELSKLAYVELKGQTPGNTLTFRYAPIGKVAGAFSQPKSIMVI
ncbi:MAG: hypothetical protein IT236_08090 [Bacteroidia bacterium]|nr:hypothetical protein [Bacteroidia bacterium]